MKVIRENDNMTTNQKPLRIKNKKLKKPKKPKQKLIPGAAKPAGKGAIHLGRWFEEEDAKPKAKAVRKVPSFGGKPKGGKK